MAPLDRVIARITRVVAESVTPNKIAADMRMVTPMSALVAIAAAPTHLAAANDPRLRFVFWCSAGRQSDESLYS
jgi:hypothetical protein